MRQKKKTGRPKAKISQNEFEKLCALQCTMLEICGFFDVTDKTLTNWCIDTYGKSFSEVFKLKRGNGKVALRRTQWQIAENGNAAMAIFLGKNYLDQTDKQEINADLTLNEREALKEEAAKLMKDMI